MQRVLEPELMLEEEQVKAYAEADFSEPHSHFIQLIQQYTDTELSGNVLDLGCGAGDISFRFARVFPECHVVAVDGSKVMLKYARFMTVEKLKKRIEFIQARLPNDPLPDLTYSVIFSNSLLHHLPMASTLWSAIRQYGQPGTRVYIMDLVRPSSVTEAKFMTTRYAAQEPEVLQRDFYHSLLAAFSLDEIKFQLEKAGLNLALEQISDRHVFINGVL